MTEPLPADTRTNEQLSAEIARRLFDQLEGHEWKIGKARVSWKDLASDYNATLGLVVSEMLETHGYNFSCGRNDRGWWAVFKQPFYVYADTLPRAIYLAALAALDAEEEQG